MPHVRVRYGTALIERALKHSPIVGILGQRQVGKTTLASALGREYVTFDSSQRLDEANAHPGEFLENRKTPFAIDEVQLCPPLFPAAKEWVRLHPKKGQLIFTGSVRFTSRKAIRESLTGRIVNVEILPMTMSESAGSPLPSHLASIVEVDTPKKLETFWDQRRAMRAEPFARYLDTGGLPGICFFRDASVRADRFEAHLDTLLNRDLKLVLASTLSSLQLRKLAAFLAAHQGVPLELKSAAQAAQTSTTTIKKLLIAFEALFLIRPAPTEGTVSKTSYYFEDQGLASHLLRAPLSQEADILRGLYANLRQELQYRPHPRNAIFSYRTHDGAEVPLAFRMQQGVVGIIPTDERLPPLKARACAKSFLRAYPGAKVMIACNSKEVETRDFQVFQIPYWWVS